MSLKSYFRKKHKYETQADLQNMTAEQIVSLNPDDVGYYIETETGGIPLRGAKQKAMFNLLAYKKVAKDMGQNPELRSKQIDTFLKRENLREDPAVTSLIVQTNKEVMSDRVTQKQLENRLRKLKGEPEVPYTNEEQMYIRVQNLGSGGKRRRTTKKKITRKKKHGRKHKKTYRKK